MIQHIERRRASGHVHPLANPKRASKRNVEIVESGSGQRVPAERAQRIIRRNGKRARGEEPHSTRNWNGVPGRSHQVRPLIQNASERNRRLKIVGKARAKRRETRRDKSVWQVPISEQNKIVTLVEIRVAAIALRIELLRKRRASERSARRLDAREVQIKEVAGERFALVVDRVAPGIGRLHETPSRTIPSHGRERVVVRKALAGTIGDLGSRNSD